MKILVLIAAYKRHSITRLVINNLKQFDVDILVVGSGNDNYASICSEMCVKYVQANNLPLGKKWNRGLQFALQKLEFTHLLILGSDNLINQRTIDAYRKYKSFDLVSFNDLYFYNCADSKVKHLGGFNLRTNRIIGAGLLINKKLLRLVDGDLWNNDINKGLDHSMLNSLKRVKRDLKVKHIGSKDKCFLMDVKSDVNIHSFSSIKGYDKGCGSLFSHFNPNIISKLKNLNFKNMDNQKLSVVVPYVNTNKDFKELVFALRSFDKHFKEDFQLVIIGDKPDFLDPKSYVFIEQKRKPVKDFPNCFDANKKLNTILLDAGISDNFIITYDDIYLLKDITLSELDKPRRIERPAEFSKSKYADLIKRTMSALKAKHIKDDATFLLCETHTPRVINKKLMINTFKTFLPIKNRLLVYSLYFNQHFTAFDNINKSNKIKVGFYGKSDNWGFSSNVSVKAIHKLLSSETALFLNHNDAGLSDSLKSVIVELFPNKSRFEK